MRAGPMEQAGPAPRLRERDEADATRLLKRLAGPGLFAERCADGVRVLQQVDGTLRDVGTCPNGALSALVMSGAVTCTTETGRPRFRISEAGRAALFRQECARRDPSEDAPFARQHRVMGEHAVTEEGRRVSLRVNLRDNPLALLARQRDSFARGYIGPAAIQAGDRLARDMELGRIEPKMGINWQAIGAEHGSNGGRLSLPEIAMEARTRIRHALHAVGPDHAGILMDLCGFSKGLEQIERERGLPVRSGKVWVGLALRALARHYGLADEARGPERTRLRSVRFPNPGEGAIRSA